MDKYQEDSDTEDRGYNTTDFYIAALLVCLGYEIQEITREGKPDKDGLGKTRRFHFEGSKILRDDIMDYVNNKKVVKAKDFKDAIETIKDLVHS